MVDTVKIEVELEKYLPFVICPKCGKKPKLIDADQIVMDEDGKEWYTAIYNHCDESFRIQWPWEG